MKRASLPLRRRQFIVGGGGAAVAWPVVARAQQPKMPVIGFLNGGRSTASAYSVAAFRQGLADSGYVEGQNVSIEYRWADGDYKQLAGMAEDLVRRQASVIVATGGTASGLAAKVATTTIPIVFSNGSDPVNVSRFFYALNCSGRVVPVTLAPDLGSTNVKFISGVASR